MDSETYLQQVQQRLTDDGCATSREIVGRVEALVGHRATFVPAALSRMHVVSAVAVFDPAPGDIAAYARDVSVFAKQRSKALLGLQSGVAAFPVVLTRNPRPEVIADAVQKPRLEFAVRVQPVLVDLEQGVVHTFRGRQVVGAALNGAIRRKLEAYFPVPSASPAFD